MHEHANLTEEQLAADLGSGDTGRTNLTEDVITLPTGVCRWARVYLARGEPAGEFAVPLLKSLTEWMRKCPQLRVKFIVPITSNGDTSELHAWYEQAPLSGSDSDAGGRST